MQIGGAECRISLYNQRLADALNQLVAILEDMLPDVEREKQEAQDAKQYMGELEGLVKQYAEKLKTARHTVEQAKKVHILAQLEHPF